MTDMISRADARPVQVGIKPLEWKEITSRVFAAVGFNCRYQIRIGRDGSVRWQDRDMGQWEDAASPDDAKSAAQADYEARIRSALTVTPADQNTGQALVKKIVQNRIDTIVREEGSWEPDTNVTNLPEWAETAIEELEGILAALAAMKEG